MKKNLHWLFWALITFLFAGCADIGEQGTIEEEAGVSENALLRFTSLTREIYNQDMSEWRIAGVNTSATSDNPYLDAISNGCDGTTSYIYSHDPTSTKFLPMGFQTDLSQLPALCRFKEVYWDACLRLKNGNDLSTATMSVEGVVVQTAKKSTYNGVPRLATAYDKKTFQDLVNLGVNTSAFVRIPLQKINGWNVSDCNATGSSCTTIGTNVALNTYELWRKSASQVSTVIDVADWNNQLQISSFRIRVRCDE